MKSKIIYEDSDILVIDKPAGIAVQSASSFGADVESELKKYMAKTTGKPEIYVIHRLDQPVSGLLVFAKNKKAAAVLSKAVAGESFNKIYRAGVFGSFEEGEGELVDYIEADKKAGIARIVPASKAKDGKAKKAVLKYRTLERSERESLLEIKLDTGRFHQIRVQTAHAGHPILGDLKYGSEESKELSESLGIKNVCLRAVSLSFKHPTTGKTVDFTAEEMI